MLVGGRALNPSDRNKAVIASNVSRALHVGPGDTIRMSVSIRPATSAVARVVAVADAFDAMTSARPYRDALSPHAALLEIERCAGSQFDPELASAFVAVCSDARAA